MIKEKTLNLKLALLLGLIACMVTVLFCTAQNAYAEELNSDNGGIVATNEDDPCEVNRLKTSKIVYRENRGIVHFGSDKDTFHVDQTGVQPGGVKHFNRLDVTRDGKTFTIYYDFRGYFGDICGIYGRASHVQYFYNSRTEEMYIIGFDGSTHDFNTYNYVGSCSSAFSTVFQDNINYGDGCEMKLSENVKTIYLDTKIREVLKQGFYEFDSLEKVDILGQLYESSSLYDLSERSFSICGGLGTVKMNMLKAKHMKHSMDYYLHDDPDWRNWTKITVD